MKKIFLFLGIIISVLIILLFLINSKSALSVETSTPADKSLNVPVASGLSVMFGREISQAEQTNIKVGLSPSVGVSMYWSTDNKTLYILPSNNLLENTNYKASLSLGGQSYSWSFTTSSQAPPTEEQLSQEQGLEDVENAKIEASFLQDYPWYNKIPEPNANYFISFDEDEDKFLIYIYPIKESSTPMSTQEENLKSKVINVLKGIGVDTNKYKIEWNSVPR